MGTVRQCNDEYSLFDYKLPNGKETQVLGIHSLNDGILKKDDFHLIFTKQPYIGHIYEGELNDIGQIHGKGVYTYPDGSKYIGEWKNGKMYGNGVYTYPDGSEYVGEMKDNKRHGEGVYTYPDGSKYVGKWKNDKRDGKGTYIYPDGSKYVGKWKNDKRNCKDSQVALQKLAKASKQHKQAHINTINKQTQTRDSTAAIINNNSHQKNTSKPAPDAKKVVRKNTNTSKNVGVGINSRLSVNNLTNDPNYPKFIMGKTKSTTRYVQASINAGIPSFELPRGTQRQS
jgi:hypothetical protein